MSYLLTATVEGRTVAFGEDPTGTFSDGTWYEYVDGRLSAELALRWTLREAPSYLPGLLDEEAAFIEEHGGTDIVRYNRPGPPKPFNPDGSPPVY